MSHPQDPRQPPLQDDEAALARVLHALPAGEPSARVDAAILAAARNAAAAQRPARAKRRLPGWAIGTAAAAVLAVGIGLQLRPEQASGLPEGLPVENPGEPVATPLPPPPPAEALPVPPPPPPPPAFAEPPAASAPAPTPEVMDEAAARERRIESAKAQARAAMDQQLQQDSAEREAAERAQAERREEVEVTGSRRAMAPPPVAEAAPVAEPLPAPAPVAAAPPAPPAPVATPAPAAQSLGAAGAAKAMPLPPVDEDAALAPEAWLERIRERLRQGDRAGARASLLRLERTHPGFAIPDDLALLKQ